MFVHPIIYTNPYCMMPEQITAILESDLNSSKKTAKVLTPVGIVLLVAGLVMYFMLAGSLKTVGIVVAVIGVLCVAGAWLVGKGNQTLETELEYARTTLKNNPGELVWAYIDEYNHKGSQLLQVKFGFRNGMLMSINKDQLPDKDMQGFLNMLQKKYNPAIVLGYSEEMEFKFNNKQL